MSYEFLAEHYDRLNKDVPYKTIADFTDTCIKKYGKNRENILLDLACGTGKLSFEMLDKGYQVIGVDISEEMLSVAQKQNAERTKKALFLCQDMCGLDLYGTVDACVCALDSLNYILSPSKLKKCFSLVNNFMYDGGIFVFDIDTPYKFENIYSDSAYVLDEDGVTCCWRNYYDAEKARCDFYLSFFVENSDGTYSRYDENQCVKKYEIKTVKKYLELCGFEVLDIFGDYDFSTFSPQSERAVFVAKAINKNK